MLTLGARILLLLTLALLLAAATYGIANSQSANGKYDTDGDGLIEIQYLEQLDAIRYDLDGDGRSDDERYSAAFPISAGETVCNCSCEGYELARWLDFKDPGSYASGMVNVNWMMSSGWLPLGLVERGVITLSLTVAGTLSPTCILSVHPSLTTQAQLVFWLC